MTDNHSPRSEHVTVPDTRMLRPDGGTARHREILSESELKESFPDWREQIRHSERLDAQSADYDVDFIGEDADLPASDRTESPR